jgi:hypothetical protein
MLIAWIPQPLCGALESQQGCRTNVVIVPSSLWKSKEYRGAKNVSIFWYKALSDYLPSLFLGPKNVVNSFFFSLKVLDFQYTTFFMVIAV